ncbi:glutaredoxin domain-containing protein [Geobacter sulfurreducens]|uniref:glutaredoxin domain-containing protein n=1 Tax=Geobacter sulfurreducens TaxID=35554 RepID=UPI0020B88D7E|nr:glutaredoxin domain-containing protein [Geobacter sulfurreducens]UTG92131.1 glutaredoxin family protein [Geobacter sulfurreducens]
MTESYRFVLITLLAGVLMLPAVGSDAAGSAPQSAVTARQKETAASHAVVIYTLSTCPHCAEAKAYLTKQGIPFTNREVDTDDDHMAELMKIYDDMKVPNERRGVPLFVIGGKTRLQGFDKAKLEEAIKAEAGK